MIYVDSSVVLAYLFAEIRIPPASIWKGALVASRLLEYEVWTRLHGRRGITPLHHARAREILGQVALVEMTRHVLARVLEPFPLQVRTLDAVHLATADHLGRQGRTVPLASYDNRLVAAARALDIPIAEL